MQVDATNRKTVDGTTQRVDGVSACQHFDPYQLTIENVYPTYRALLQQCPVAHSDTYGGFWLLSRYKDVAAVLRDPYTFASGEGVHVPHREDGVRAAPLDFDPPEHTRYRNFMAGPLSAGAVAQLEPFIRQLVRSLLEPYVAAGGGDFVEAVAMPLPLQVISRVLGLSPEASRTVRELTERLWKEYGEKGNDARQPLAEFLLQEAYDRRAHPRDDFLTALVQSAPDGQPFDDTEIQSILVAMANAGHQTTLNAASNTFYHLAQHPEQQAQLREEPARIPGFVEESLRMYPPVHMFLRTVTRDVEIGGQAMRKGDKVMLVYAAANRDPEQFPEPEAFSMDRPNNRHFSFGWGIHFCLGATLARVELRILLEEAGKHPPFRLDGTPIHSAMEGGHHLGVSYLPLAFTH